MFSLAALAEKKMPIGYHIIFGAYGFWLPNDPRGSWSNYVGSINLAKHGRTTKSTEILSDVAVPIDHAKRLAAKESLQRPAVKFSGLQAKDIADGFGDYVRKVGVTVWACAILPDHVHLVTSIGHIAPSNLAIQFKSHATRRLMSNQRHPFGHLAHSNTRPPPCFARGEWTTFLDNLEDIELAVRYVRENPLKEGFKPQRWSFVCPFSQ